ncbi:MULTISPECIES: hypothetical protein [unclassified Aureispira]|uniref:hypothetical protein n=1 Tax=unclassified Aureispira TaxID=2649989 RepID=UPI00069743EE|nr:MULTISPECIES: hypothetical protein [unclassified Aureispira]WMX17446.1 hypothetical protein QP953_13775 [Aureispira sp. CCB-E]
MKMHSNQSTPFILIIAVILAIILGLLDAQTESFTQLFVGDSGANLIALIMYTSMFALIISFLRLIITTSSPVSEDIEP